MENQLRRKCACGGRALPDNDLCFGCMEDKLLRASCQHINIDEVREEMLTPQQKKLKGQGLTVRTQWAPVPRKKSEK